MKLASWLISSLLVLLLLLGLAVAPVKPVAAKLAPEPAFDMPLSELVQFALQDIDGFWRRTFNGRRWRYAPPTEIVPYARPIRTACGTAPLDNASYCPASHGLYFDVGFLKKEYQKVGDFAVVTIIAHEWGHLVQRQLGVTEDKFYTIQQELQADCFAGRYARHAKEMEYLEDGDLAEGIFDLFNKGDAAGTTWFDEQAHGQPGQRAAAFIKGYVKGLDACLAICDCPTK